MHHTREPRSRDKPRERRHGFVEIPLVEAGHQTGRSRFADFSPNHLRDDSTPYLNSWRNNLTALSQVHNLYFIAYEDTIHVFRPQFPCYSLASHPLFVIRLPSTGSNIPAHTRDSKPHSVNSVLVDNLGNKEIILCACDDGDVLAYWTDQIEGTIRRGEDARLEACRKQSLSVFVPTISHNDTRGNHGKRQSGIGRDEIKWGSDAAQVQTQQDNLQSTKEIKALLHTNVGASAWGLAVHTAQRMIAVSCNNPKIKVFKFACVSTVMSAQAEQETLYNRLFGMKDESYADNFWSIHDISLDQELVARHFNHSYTFTHHRANIPSIAFDDVEGQTLLVSTDISGLVIVWDLNYAWGIRALLPSNYFTDEVYNPVTPGWGVMFIDRRAFTPAEDVVAAMGCCKTYAWKDAFVADTSDNKISNNKVAPLYINNQKLLTTTWTSPQPEMEIEDVNSDGIVHSDTNEGDVLLPNLFDVNDRRSLLALNQNSLIPHNVLDASTLLASSLKYTLTMTPLETENSAISNDMKYSALVLLNPRKVNLFQDAKFGAGNCRSPIVHLNDPLRQNCTAQVDWILKDWDRMNLYRCIPELGVLLIGSPKGRVAVLSLWSLRNPWCESNQPVCSMRLDHVLPTKAQEAEGVRPVQPLVGLAASPLPGHYPGEAVPERSGLVAVRKWRVLLMYKDHTLLTYEITRESDSAFGGVHVG